MNRITSGTSLLHQAHQIISQRRNNHCNRIIKQIASYAQVAPSKISQNIFMPAFSVPTIPPSFETYNKVILIHSQFLSIHFSFKVLKIRGNQQRTSTDATEKYSIYQKDQNTRTNSDSHVPCHYTSAGTKKTKTHNLFIAIQVSSDLKKCYSNQTRKLHHISSRVNRYIMILYDYNTNVIILCPLKPRQSEEIT